MSAYTSMMEGAVSTGAMALDGGSKVAILAAGSATLVFAPMALLYPKVSDGQTPEPLRLTARPIVGVAAVALLVIVNQLLNRGLQFG